MSSEESSKVKLNYRAPQLMPIPGNSTENGAVHFWENFELFPNGVQRCFWISGVKSGESRGNHAHFQESQVLVALAGQLEVRVTGLDGNYFTFHLSAPGTGLFVPPYNWIEIYFSVDAVLLGIGDQAFSEDDYIRDKDYFGSLR